MPAGPGGSYEPVVEAMEAGQSQTGRPEAAPLLAEAYDGMTERSLMETSGLTKDEPGFVEPSQNGHEELELMHSAAAPEAHEAAGELKSENRSPQAASSLPPTGGETQEAPQEDMLDLGGSASAAVPPHLQSRNAPAMGSSKAGAPKPATRPVEEVAKGRACCGPCGK